MCPVIRAQRGLWMPIGTEETVERIRKGWHLHYDEYLLYSLPACRKSLQAR